MSSRVHGLHLSPRERSPRLRGPRAHMRLADVATVVQREPFIPPTQGCEAIFPCGCDRKVKAQCRPYVGEGVAVEVAALVFHTALADNALVDRRSFAGVVDVKAAISWCPTQTHREVHDARGWTRELIERCGNTKGFCVAVCDVSTHASLLSCLRSGDPLACLA